MGPVEIFIVVVVLIGIAVLYNRWTAAQVEIDSLPNALAESRTPGHTITRIYKGSPENAADAYQRDAAQLARDSYYPVGQTHTAGSWGCGAFLVALLLCLVFIGILIFVYMLIVKPPGTLVVTYEYRPAAQVRPPLPTAAAPPQDPAAVLASLAMMMDRGLISPEEYDAKKAELLSRM